MESTPRGYVEHTGNAEDHYQMEENSKHLQPSISSLGNVSADYSPADEGDMKIKGYSPANRQWPGLRYTSYRQTFQSRFSDEDDTFENDEPMRSYSPSPYNLVTTKAKKRHASTFLPQIGNDDSSSDENNNDDEMAVGRSTMASGLDHNKTLKEQLESDDTLIIEDIGNDDSRSMTLNHTDVSTEQLNSDDINKTENNTLIMPPDTTHNLASTSSQAKTPSKKMLLWPAQTATNAKRRKIEDKNIAVVVSQQWAEFMENKEQMRLKEEDDNRKVAEAMKREQEAREAEEAERARNEQNRVFMEMRPLSIRAVATPYSRAAAMKINGYSTATFTWPRFNYPCYYPPTVEYPPVSVSSPDNTREDANQPTTSYSPSTYDGRTTNTQRMRYSTPTLPLMGLDVMGGNENNNNDDMGAGPSTASSNVQYDERFRTDFPDDLFYCSY